MDFSNVPDHELVASAANGNSAAFGQIYDRYLDQIYRYIAYRVNAREEAEDLAEAVFLKAYEHIRNRSTRIVDVKPWLYRVARNTVIDHYRTRKNHVGLDGIVDKGTDDPPPEQLVQSAEQVGQMKNALQRLEPAYQEVLLLRFVNNLSYEETAAIMGTKADTLRVTQYRALKKLREIMNEEEHG